MTESTDLGKILNGITRPKFFLPRDVDPELKRSLDDYARAQDLYLQRLCEALGKAIQAQT